MRNLTNAIVIVTGIILMLVGAFGLPSWTGVDFNGFTAFDTDKVKAIGNVMAFSGLALILFLIPFRRTKSRRSVYGMIAGGIITGASLIIALLVDMNMWMMIPLSIGIILMVGCFVEYVVDRKARQKPAKGG